MSHPSTARTKPTPVNGQVVAADSAGAPKQRAATTRGLLTAEQAFLRDAVRDVQWAQRGVLGRLVRRAATT
jgi:hypothetical protein